MIQLLLVGIGAAFGGMARYGFSSWLKKAWQTRFPYATFLINLSGSFMLGVVYGMALSQPLQLFIGAGFMGGFTTFSTFKIESMELYLQKKYRLFFLYTMLSYACGIGLAFCGVLVGKTV